MRNKGYLVGYCRYCKKEILSKEEYRLNEGRLYHEECFKKLYSREDILT